MKVSLNMLKLLKVSTTSAFTLVAMSILAIIHAHHGLLALLTKSREEKIMIKRFSWSQPLLWSHDKENSTSTFTKALVMGNNVKKIVEP